MVDWSRPERGKVPRSPPVESGSVIRNWPAGSGGRDQEWTPDGGRFPRKKRVSGTAVDAKEGVMVLPRMRSPRGSTRQRVVLWSALAAGSMLASVGCQVEYAGMTLPS